MLDTVSSWFDWLGLTSAHLVAVVVALLISQGVTQAVKSATRGTLYALHGNLARLLAFLLACAAAFTICPQPRGWLEFWLSIATGLLAPALYKVFVHFAGSRWEWVANLSGDRDG